MNMFARFDQIPKMTFNILKKQSFMDGRTHARTDRRTDNVKQYTNHKQICGGMIIHLLNGRGYYCIDAVWRKMHVHKENRLNNN